VSLSVDIEDGPRVPLDKKVKNHCLGKIKNCMYLVAFCCNNLSKPALKHDDSACFLYLG
jgi:hypothetical protein